MLALETKAVDSCAGGAKSCRCVMAATELVIMACWQVMLAGGLMLAWQQERWPVMLEMRASMTRAVDARAGDVVNLEVVIFWGGSVGGCRPLSWWERPGQFANPLSCSLTLV